MSKNCKITIKDEVWCYLTGLLPDDVEFLWKKFGIFVDGYFFMPAYKTGRWDGKIRFFEKTGRTYYRLLDKILPHLEHLGYELDLVDNRKVFVNPSPVGVLTSFDTNGIALTAEGCNVLGEVEVGGKPFSLRPYQLQVVNDCIAAGSGFAIAGTGSGKCVAGDTLINIRTTPRLRDAIDEIRKANLPHLQSGPEN